MASHPTITLKEAGLKQLKAACSTCSLHELCLPVGLSGHEMSKLESLITQSRHFRKNEHLYRAGQALTSLYAIRTGYFKTSVLSVDGREQVTGFQMAGEIIGLDAISTERHSCDAIALEDSEVCEIPFARLEDLSREIPSLQHHLYKVMSREIVRDHGVMMLLGNMNAEERLATFLLNLSQRLQARGYSSKNFILRMTREEIGSYLGLKLETVSRTLSKLQEDGLIKVAHKQIDLLDPVRLRELVGGAGGGCK